VRLVETKREVSRADIAEPKMFTPAKLPPIAIEGTAKVGRKSFRQEQLSVTQRTEGNRAGGVCAFMEHWLGPVFSSLSFGKRLPLTIARKVPGKFRVDSTLLPRSYRGLANPGVPGLDGL
jgi:hypothetical protein